MERRAESPMTNEREMLISEAYAEKKGRDVNAKNPFTCYVNINSPRPNLPLLTASLLEELDKKPFEACLWASRWDKSVISVAPQYTPGCVFLREDDSKGKSFVPVFTTEPVNTAEILAEMPQGELGFIGINDRPMTIDAFLITYFHMVNELIWDMAVTNQGEGRVEVESYVAALEKVIEKGFSVGLVSESEIIQARKQNPGTSVRIYGSGIDKFVPQIMGMIVKP